ncbi:UNVERIFIED_ORG: glutaredoxin [Arthrobacter sp. UYCu721]
MTTSTTAANAETLPTVTVFSKNDCSRCDATEAKFIKAGVPFREINVEEDTEPRAEFGNKTALEHVVERYGRTMPVVVVENGVWDDHWSSLRPDKVLELIALFEKQGATIPAGERAAHKTNNL